MTNLTAIHTDDAPAPAGHYAQAIHHGDLVFVAGQLPIDPSDREREPGDVEEQTERALRNVEAILRAAGSGLDRLLSVTIYVTDIAVWGRVNSAYARVLGDHRPARAVVPVPELHHGYAIEIQAIAAVQSAALTMSG
jgi:2-iminobutanoate/2-iminopropanoate deaminase